MSFLSAAYSKFIDDLYIQESHKRSDGFNKFNKGKYRDIQPLQLNTQQVEQSQSNRVRLKQLEEEKSIGHIKVFVSPPSFL